VVSFSGDDPEELIRKGFVFLALGVPLVRPFSRAIPLTPVSSVKIVSFSRPNPFTEGETYVTLTGSASAKNLLLSPFVNLLVVFIELFGSEEILGGGGGGIGDDTACFDDFVANEVCMTGSILINFSVLLVGIPDAPLLHPPNDNVNLSPPTETNVALDMSGISLGGGESPVKFKFGL